MRIATTISIIVLLSVIGCSSESNESPSPDSNRKPRVSSSPLSDEEEKNSLDTNRSSAVPSENLNDATDVTLTSNPLLLAPDASTTIEDAVSLPKTNSPTPAELESDNDSQLSQKAESSIDAANRAFAALIEAHRSADPQSWQRAADELASMPSAAIPIYAEALRKSDAAARELATMMLAGLGPEAEPAADQLLLVLDDSSLYTRANAAAALANFPEYADQIVPVLIELLDEEDENVRLMATFALGQIGPQAESALPTLNSILETDNAQLREAAAEAIRQIRPMTEEQD